ncbi:MAG: SUMF1/EgtB/PvdO family nonheme iron enzyme, partial [Anaerolineae bacterium]
TSTSTRQSTTASSATATPSNSPSPTRTFTATVDIAATSDAATATQQAAGTRQSATQNAVQTLAARATSDASKTLAARATNSVGPTQTAQAIAAIQIAETNREVNVRGEPNTSAPIVATLRQGTSVTIIGSNDDETWFNVRLNNGTEGWIRADLLTVFGPPTATPSPTPEPQVEEFDGVPMVLVPAGCFVMGSDDTQLEEAIGMGLPQNIADVEKPAEKICFDAPFWIDQYEVTNGQFDQYNGQAAMPAVNDDANKPREQVSWYEAKAYCEQRGGRLPTEAEWEYAARGPAGLIYPWGNEFEPDNVVFLDNSGKEAQPVGSRPDGVSWVGAYDMSGNVWEWTNSLFREYPYDAADGREGEGEENRSIRGGSYQDLDEFLRTSMRSFWIASADAYPSLGFRCARDTEE